MHLAVLSLYLNFETFGPSQDGMRRGTVRLGRAAFRQEKLITNLAEHFFASVTRDFCRHSVDVKNPTVSAHKHHGLRETFENSAIESLRLLGRSPRATRSPFGGLSAQQLRPKIGFFERSR
jgi:hypothetical protein